MKTLLFKSETGNAAEIIKKGGLVAVPTETVYGLACSGLNESAVKQVYDVKGRPEVKPLSLMVHDKSQVLRWCEDVPDNAMLLADSFWPGPLTIILKSKNIIPEIVRAGGTTVGMRCPASELTLKLLKEAELPFAAPSANPSGAPSPKNAATVMAYFNGKIDAVIDGGECSLGIESTIIAMDSLPYKILRQGALPKSDIEDALVDGMKIIGITGGTGCGKTTALNSLSENNALIIDCDAIYHELLEKSDDLINAIDRRFPGLIHDKQLNTKDLGKIVFSDKDSLEDLNNIAHYYVVDEVRTRLRDFAMNGGKLAAIDAIELFSSGADMLCDLTVGIVAPLEERLKRIMSRDNISEEYAIKRIKAQHSDEYFYEHCDTVILNDSDEESFLNKFLKYINEVD